MRIFAVLGTAPCGTDRLSLLEIEHVDMLLSFHDYKRSYHSLHDLCADLLSAHAHLPDHLSTTTKGQRHVLL